MGRAQVRFAPGTPGGDYRVIDTDYETYAMVFSCTDFVAGAFSSTALWFLTREPLNQQTQEFKDM